MAHPFRFLSKDLRCRVFLYTRSLFAETGSCVRAFATSQTTKVDPLYAKYTQTPVKDEPVSRIDIMAYPDETDEIEEKDIEEKNKSDEVLRLQLVQFAKKFQIAYEDALNLSKLKKYIDHDGGHPDFPRKSIKKEDWDTLDTAVFKWICKQRILYQHGQINPWIQWQMEQLNISVEWTRYPLADRHFSWIGQDQRTKGNAGTNPSRNAESDPLFPLNFSDDTQTLQFVNPGRNVVEEGRFLKHFIVKYYNWDEKNWNYQFESSLQQYANGELSNDMTLLANTDKQTNAKRNEEQHLYRLLDTVKKLPQWQEIVEANEKEQKENELLGKRANVKKQIWEKITAKENMTPLSRLDGLKFLNETIDEEPKKRLRKLTRDGIQPIFDAKYRGLMYVEALKRELIKPTHLDEYELKLVLHTLGISTSLGTEHDLKRNNSRRYINRHSASTRRKNSADFKQHMLPVRFNAYQRPHATDPAGIFDLLDNYYKTKHPMQAPFGVWDIPEPELQIELLERKVQGWLDLWRQSAEGKQFMQTFVCDTFAQACAKMPKYIIFSRNEREHKLKILAQNPSSLVGSDIRSGVDDFRFSDFTPELTTQYKKLVKSFNSINKDTNFDIFFFFSGFQKKKENLHFLNVESNWLSQGKKLCAL
ncbi:hypothetical protein RFI_23905 [Reticulomyxa filosa]|uniref:Uncharacterized protein n=1 Tax=Reticulomyxa filosa TaxID=46433 RepID=X6MHY5_RETFI|nr:hypothetical protein RFI_23905 [Reticulomyxa filosa]|eukprot:ETO13469.1 hypothetical protein RFI_23905 [Reticulomyxa filosa]